MSASDPSTTPPPLDQRIALSRSQVEKITGLLHALSRSLDGLPAVLTQQGELITAAAPEAIVADRLARVAERLWRDGMQHPAREVIRFDEETIEEVERANYMLYSAHMTGALTLTVGWQTNLTLTQLRAEVAALRDRLIHVIRQP
jgi:hypothetical protein